MPTVLLNETIYLKTFFLSFLKCHLPSDAMLINSSTIRLFYSSFAKCVCFVPFALHFLSHYKDD